MARLTHAQLLTGDETSAWDLGLQHALAGREYSGGEVPRDVRRYYSQGYARGAVRRSFEIATGKREPGSWPAAAA